ncbi:SAG family member [Eimeria necatrix]|uniref:SAG family member n=1 Tax=Eimeria necatrix TaxID=51315 RepID=U6MLS3_9EIME|nr:SAG family member [Eimeria necatrix]CDJ62585.1 SAG family member [Eimeria necatrix]
MLQRNLPPLLRISFLMLSATTLGNSQETEETVTYTASLGKSVVCFSEVNAAREAAGLDDFKQASGDAELSGPAAEEGELDEKWKKLCEHLIPQSEAAAKTSSANPLEAGTYAFKSLTAEQPNCKEAVDYWKAAYKNFTGLPPSKNDAGTLYDNQDNISFVALYNPSSNATADCRVATCTQTNTSTTGPGPAIAETDGGSDTTKKGYALLCKTKPTAFASDTSAPFTQEQWDKIMSSLTGSGSIAAPSLIALAIVTFGIMTL